MNDMSRTPVSDRSRSASPPPQSPQSPRSPYGMPFDPMILSMPSLHPPLLAEIPPVNWSDNDYYLDRRARRVHFGTDNGLSYRPIEDRVLTLLQFLVATHNGNLVRPSVPEDRLHLPPWYDAFLYYLMRRFESHHILTRYWQFILEDCVVNVPWLDCAARSSNWVFCNCRVCGNASTIVHTSDVAVYLHGEDPIIRLILAEMGHPYHSQMSIDLPHPLTASDHTVRENMDTHPTPVSRIELNLEQQVWSGQHYSWNTIDDGL